ncbi:MAG TPA: dipeptidyl carboxypeptidase II, partial [Opitutus sp.]|nr:dipeptidyl carboxypeptidase II [Opitutus sp.]
MQKILLGLALAAASLAPLRAADTAMPNSLLTDSPLPFHYPQFDRITAADFAPAYEQGMAEELQEVAAIADDPAAPTFD